MDDTLIKVKGKGKFPKDENDWIFLNDQVMPKLKRYSDNDYSIIIFTNQKGISMGKT
jgi:bifunctional polynucleotide phosphatase/kinase